MTVNKEISKLEHSNVKLTMTVGKDDVRSEYNALLADYTKTIQIPGFRKGKVPMEVLVRKFGEALKGEAMGRIVEKAMDEVLKDESFPKESRPLPYSTPSLENEEKLALDLEQDLSFSVIYDVLPQVNVEKWQGFEIEIEDVAVTDADVNLELDAVRDRNAIVMDKNEGEAAAKDDVVTVNYSEIGEDGQVIAGSERADFVFTLGSGYNTFKFDDEVTGMKKGETKDIEKTYAEDFDDKELAGKTKKLRVSVGAIKVKKLPDLDDELAQDVNEKFKTLDDLKADIKERLERDLDLRVRERKVSGILEKIMEVTPVEIPESMTRLELDSRWRNLARRFNTDSEGLYKIMGGSPQGAQGIIDSWKPDANRALHSRLIVETLIENQKIEAGDDEAEREIEKQAKESGAALEEFKKYYEQDQMKEYLKEEIKERKLLDRLIAENTVKPGKRVNFVDFVSKNG